MDRSPRPSRLVTFLVVAAILVSGAACSTTWREARIGTGFISYTLCAGVFVSRLDPVEVYAETIKPVLPSSVPDWIIHRDIDVAARQVRTTVVGLAEARAIHRDGMGCLVVHGAEPAETGVPGDLQPARSLLAEIAGPEVVEPSDERLRTALDRAFAEPSDAPSRRTKAVVVVHAGRVIAERYARSYGVETPVPGYSDTKSVISALIGILVRDGRLSVTDPAPVPGWRGAGDPRGAITIDHLLRMTSGLAWDEVLTGSTVASDTRMSFVERDMAAFAERAPLETAPGATWMYNSGNTMILSRIIRDAVGGGARDVLRFAHRELFGPLGMRNVTLPLDATGTPVGSRAMLASARDWARFGMLYLNDGVVGGRRILPEGWVQYSSAPTPGARLGYGAGFWTNFDLVPGAARRRGWGMPADSFYASGWLGQIIVMVPSEQLVAARFGVSHNPLADHDGVLRLVADVLAAIKK
jgi:CubicO group peptidase (beta-lactamase class C family)